MTLEVSVPLGRPLVLPSPAARQRIRRSRGLTLAAIAELLCVDLATVSRWERGHVEPHGAARLLYASLLEGLRKDDTPLAGTGGASGQSDGAALHVEG